MLYDGLGHSRGRKLKYEKAEAKIVGNDTITVSANGITEPKFVRFGWHSPVYTNLINKEGHARQKG